MKYIKWTISVLFIIAAIGNLGNQNYFATIPLLLAALLLLPPLENFWESKIPALKNKVIKGISIFALLILFGALSPSEKKDDLKEKDAPLQENIVKKRKFELKTVTSYYESPYTKKGYEHIKTYYFGVYLNLPADTTGISEEIISYLKEIASETKENEAVNMWVFTDSTIIPKSFKGEWSNAENQAKCFASVSRFTNGYIDYFSGPF